MHCAEVLKSLSTYLPTAVPGNLLCFLSSADFIKNIITKSRTLYFYSRIFAFCGSQYLNSKSQKKRTAHAIVSAGKHFSNTNLSDLSIVGTCDIFVYRKHH